MNSTRVRFGLLIASLVLVTIAGLGSSRVEAQEVARYGDIPADSISIASVNLDQLRQMRAPQYLPWEIAEVICREQFGFDLAIVESIDVTVSMPSPMPEVGFALRLSETFDIADLSDQIAGPIETSPKEDALRYRDLSENPMFRIAQRDPKRVLVATQGTMRRMLSQRIQTGGPTVSLVQGSNSPVRMAINVSKVRDLIQGFYDQSEPSIPPPMREEIQNVIALTENLLLEILPVDTEEPSIRVSIGAATEPNADSLFESINRLRSEGLQLVGETVDVQVRQDPSMSDAMKEAVIRYSDRMRTRLGEEKLWTLEGDRVYLNMENSIAANYSTIGVLTGLLLPAVQAAREAARRQSSSNNIRQLMLGLHNYHSVHGKLPDRIQTDGDGQPLLSWRVMILPYLEENDLLDEFHLDEPWDSPHNLSLVERMPAIFASPRVETPPGHTVYLAPFGKETGWPEQDLTFSQILDGTSNTIALVEASGYLAVPWTKPDDLDVDAHPGSSWMPPGSGTNVAMFDGSVRYLTAMIAEEVLQALFSPDGGESVFAP